MRSNIVAGLTDIPVLTVGDLAKRTNTKPWQIRAIFDRGFLPPPMRMGLYRVVAEADLPKVEEALKAAGYLHDPEQQRDGAA